MDPVTLGMAKADARKRARDQRAPGNIGQRIFGGRMGTYDGSTATTFQVTCELQQHFDAIQLIFANHNAAYSLNAVQCKAAALPSAADLNGNSAAWVPVTKMGMNRMMLTTPLSGDRIAYTVSDMIPLASVPRSDAGTNPIVVIRAYMTNNSTISVVGNGTDSFTNWATRTDGRLWAMRAQTGDQVTTPTTWTSTTNISQSPIVGVRYLARGKVVNVMAVGDSISDGRGTYLGEGFGGLVADRLSEDDIAVEYSNCGWAGQSTTSFANRAMDILQSDVKPDVLMFPSNSPNNETNFTAAGIVSAAAHRSRVLAECARVGTVPVLWTLIPCSPAVHDWGATDALRVADNAAVLALRQRGVLVADTATALSGPVVGGQVGLPAEYAPDGIHPGDLGSAMMADLLEPLVARGAGL
ncbi:SGNH/GDSL hydrolase family protein [Rhodococcus sp. MSC1_016]|jgi:lysophospholipase L1-like esterase|uniref:SGNH/GDSL hydrolase family protein n=1 Tax=Rhodococcus sp. MSC1_016 TaxID=2909266 RepID=UPI00203031A7|nr:SGNH/GDSL hydrolase family protein [Rhodococcus sp. MSC1_016]